MKVRSSFVVLGAAVILAVGGAMAVNAATNSSVALCVPKSVGVVTVNGDGPCPSGSKKVVLPTEGSVDAIDTGVLTGSGIPETVPTENGGLEPDGLFYLTVTGTHLAPGADVRGIGRQLYPDEVNVVVSGTVDDQGNFSSSKRAECVSLPIVLTSTTAAGRPISFTLSDVEDCD